jgi:dTDP-D-glucose 4,6-dehydratase
VGDHNARGLLHAGETYNVGGETVRWNIDLVHRLCEIVAEETGKPASVYTSSGRT